MKTITGFAVTGDPVILEALRNHLIDCVRSEGRGVVIEEIETIPDPAEHKKESAAQPHGKWLRSTVFLETLANRQQEAEV